MAADGWLLPLLKKKLTHGAGRLAWKLRQNRRPRPEKVRQVQVRLPGGAAGQAGRHRLQEGAGCGQVDQTARRELCKEAGEAKGGGKKKEEEGKKENNDPLLRKKNFLQDNKASATKVTIAANNQNVGFAFRQSVIPRLGLCHSPVRVVHLYCVDNEQSLSGNGPFI